MLNILMENIFDRNELNKLFEFLENNLSDWGCITDYQLPGTGFYLYGVSTELGTQPIGPPKPREDNDLVSWVNYKMWHSQNSEPVYLPPTTNGNLFSTIIKYAGVTFSDQGFKQRSDRFKDVFRSGERQGYYHKGAVIASGEVEHLSSIFVRKLEVAKTQQNMALIALLEKVFFQEFHRIHGKYPDWISNPIK